MRQRTKSTTGFDYQVLRSNDSWCDHMARTNVTAALIAWMLPASVLDPACGDGSIVMLADRIKPIDRVAFADVSKPNCQALISRIVGYGRSIWSEDIHDTLRRDEHFDVVVLTEVLEHLEDPDEVLRMARSRGDRLIASSPEMRAGQQDDNPEHLWQFDGEGYLQMLMDAGWQAIHKTHMGFPWLQYDFQVWVCR